MTQPFLDQMNAGRGALLAHIASVRDRAVAALVERAEQESAEIIGRARRSARAQVHAAVSDERHRRNSAWQRAWGEMHAAVRQAQYRQMQQLLEETRALLRTQLREFWNDSTCRAHWLDSLIALALQRIDEAQWVIEHPEGWNPGEAGNALHALSDQHHHVAVQFQAVTHIDAGFMLRCGHVTLDGTLSGLFADNRHIEGALLGMLVRMPEWPGDVAFDKPGRESDERNA